MIDLYCERVAIGLLGEPLNAISNVAFFVAAEMSRRQLRRHGQTIVPAAILAAIGLGSSLFHTFATQWAEWSDAVPIFAFQLTFLWLYLRDCVALARRERIVALAAFSAATAIASAFPHIAHGSLAYLPSVLVLLMLAGWASENRQSEFKQLNQAARLFGISLIVRTIDIPLCVWWPWGTHFVWHLLNATVLYLLLTAYASAAPQPVES